MDVNICRNCKFGKLQLVENVLGYYVLSCFTNESQFVKMNYNANMTKLLLDSEAKELLQNVQIIEKKQPFPTGGIILTSYWIKFKEDKKIEEILKNVNICVTCPYKFEHDLIWVINNEQVDM